MTETVVNQNEIEDEVVLGESVSEDRRRIRVYQEGGDFVIEVPAGAKVTFGYFAASTAFQDNRQRGYAEPSVATKTALRIYEHGEKGNQLACFLGVKGFRDETVTRTNLVQRVVVERRYASDGDGNEEWNGTQQRELVVSNEDTPF